MATFLPVLTGRLRHDPAHFPALVDDEMLDRLDAHRRGIDIERTGSFARAGQMRPVKSGKLLVECSTSSACFQLPL